MEKKMTNKNTFTLDFKTPINVIWRLEKKLPTSHILGSYNALKSDKERYEFYTMLELSYPKFAKTLDIYIQEGIVKNFNYTEKDWLKVAQ